VAHRTKAIETRDLERVVVDTTVREKAIAHPTDARLIHRAIEKLVDLARRGRQTAPELSAPGQARRHHGGALHAEIIGPSSLSQPSSYGCDKCPHDLVVGPVASNRNGNKLPVTRCCLQVTAFKNAISASRIRFALASILGHCRAGNGG
jgi:hypothetical protein